MATAVNSITPSEHHRSIHLNKDLPATLGRGSLPGIDMYSIRQPQFTVNDLTKILVSEVAPPTSPRLEMSPRLESPPDQALNPLPTCVSVFLPTARPVKIVPLPGNSHTVHPRLIPGMRSTSDNTIAEYFTRNGGVPGNPPRGIRRADSSEPIPVSASGSTISGIKRPVWVPRLQLGEKVPTPIEVEERLKLLNHLDAVNYAEANMIGSLARIRGVKSETAIAEMNDICPWSRWSEAPGILRYDVGCCDFCGERQLIRAMVVIPMRPGGNLMPWVHLRTDNDNWGPDNNRYFESFPKKCDTFVLWCGSCFAVNVNPVWAVGENPARVPGLLLAQHTRCRVCASRVEPQTELEDLWVCIKTGADGVAEPPIFIHTACRRLFKPLATLYMMFEPNGDIAVNYFAPYEKFRKDGNPFKHGPIQLKRTASVESAMDISHSPPSPAINRACCTKN